MNKTGLNPPVGFFFFFYLQFHGDSSAEVLLCSCVDIFICNVCFIIVCSSSLLGLVGCGEDVVYLTSPGRPIEIGLQLGKA